jgi:hypothetical protein
MGECSSRAPCPIAKHNTMTSKLTEIKSNIAANRSATKVMAILAGQPPSRDTAISVSRETSTVMMIAEMSEIESAVKLMIR